MPWAINCWGSPPSCEPISTAPAGTFSSIGQFAGLAAQFQHDFAQHAVLLFGIDPDFAVTVHFDHCRVASSLPLSDRHDQARHAGALHGRLMRVGNNSSVKKRSILLARQTLEQVVGSRMPPSRSRHA